ncbi:hypothetical protein [Helicobacter sp. T3_23-1056]
MKNPINIKQNLARFQLAPFSRGDYIFALILAIITAFLCVGQVDNGHNWGGDFSGYIAQAIALVQGTTEQYIAENTLMMDKCDWLFGPYAYPWGFPLILAFVYKIFGFNLVAFKAVNIICYAIFVGIFYIFCAKRLPRNYAFFATLFFVINPSMTAFVANNVLSDVSFLLFGFVALIVLAKLFCESVDCRESLCDSRHNGVVDCHDFANAKTRNDKTHPLAPSAREGGHHGLCIAILGGVFMLFASLIRMNGFVILCALMTMQGILLAKRFAPKIFKIRALQFLERVHSPYPPYIHAIPYIIFALGFLVVALNLSSGGSGHFSEIANTNAKIIFHHIGYYVKTFGDFFIAEKAHKFLRILFVFSVPLIYLGIRENLKGENASEHIFYVVFVCGFMLLLLLWIGIQGIRFVYLVLPFAVFWGAKGLFYLNSKKALFGRIMNVVLLVVLAYFAFSAKNISFTHKVSTSGAYTKDAKEVWYFIKQNTPKDSVILFHKPRVLYLNTGRIAFASNNIARFDEVDFVLWEVSLWGGVPLDSSEFIERTNLIYENAQFRLFSVKK